MGLQKLYSTRVRAGLTRSVPGRDFEVMLRELARWDNQPGATVKFAWAGRPGLMSEWTGVGKDERPIARECQVVNKEFDLRSAIPLKDLERDETGTILDGHINRFADEVAGSRWRQVRTLLRNGTGSTNGLAYDGQFFFDTDHALGSSGAQKNLLTSSDIAALNVGTSTGPTPEEFVDIVMGVIGYMTGYLDEKGEPFVMGDKRFLVIVPPGMWGAAQTSVRANNIAGGETNVVSGLMGDGFQITIGLDPGLYVGVNKDHIYVAATGDPLVKPIMFNEEVAPRYSLLDVDSEYAKEFHEIKPIAYGRWGANYGEPLKIVKATLD